MIRRGDAASKGSRLTRSDRVKVALALLVLPGLVWLLNRSYRIRLVIGHDQVQALLEGSTPVILAGWHETLLQSSGFFIDRVIKKGFPVAVLVSHSRDGEIATRFLKRIGVKTVRGSTSRGGLNGLRRLHRLLSKERRSVGIAPDGPRGPARECKPGALLLAQFSGAAVVPIASAADRAWRLGSWDRMRIPKPFARIAVAIGKPSWIAPDLDSEALAAESERLGRILNELTESAAATLDE